MSEVSVGKQVSFSEMENLCKIAKHKLSACGDVDLSGEIQRETVREAKGVLQKLKSELET